MFVYCVLSVLHAFQPLHVKIGKTTTILMNGIDEEDGGLTLPVPEGVEFLPRKVGHKVPCRSWESRPDIIFDGKAHVAVFQGVEPEWVWLGGSAMPRTRFPLCKTVSAPFCLRTSRDV